MDDHAGKVIPPAPTLAERLNEVVRQRLRDAMAALTARLAGLVEGLSDRVTDELQGDPQKHWTEAVDELAGSAIGETP